MHASLADSPDGPVAVDDLQDVPAEQPASHADPVRRDSILLVEDNSLNMRVSLRHTSCDSHVLRSRSGNDLYNRTVMCKALRANADHPSPSVAHSPHEETTLALRLG
jgi:hypothetical protein